LLDGTDIYVDTYTSPDGEEDFPVYTNDDENTLEAYNPRPSVGFEYDVYGTGSPTTEKGDYMIKDGDDDRHNDNDTDYEFQLYSSIIIIMVFLYV
jgi:hypothetical protein